MMLPPTQQTAHQRLPNMRPVGELMHPTVAGDRYAIKDTQEESK